MKHYHILYATAILLALASTFLTVSGVTQVFAGSAFFVAIIGVILEFGKYGTMWSLTKNWSDRAYKKIRWVMVCIVTFLTVLSSAGIFSYYATSYVKGTQSIADVASEVKVLDSQINESKSQVDMYKQQQTELLSQQKDIIEGLVQREYLTRASNIRKQNQAELDVLRSRIDEEISKQGILNTKRIDLQKTITQIKKDSGFISHVASTVGIDLETDADAEFKVVLILIFIILLALEPLSIFSMVMGHIDREKYLKDNSMEKYNGTIFKNGFKPSSSNKDMHKAVDTLLKDSTKDSIFDSKFGRPLEELFSEELSKDIRTNYKENQDRINNLKNKVQEMKTENGEPTIFDKKEKLTSEQLKEVLNMPEMEQVFHEVNRNNIVDVQKMESDISSKPFVLNLDENIDNFEIKDIVLYDTKGKEVASTTTHEKLLPNGKVATWDNEQQAYGSWELEPNSGGKEYVWLSEEDLQRVDPKDIPREFENVKSLKEYIENKHFYLGQVFNLKSGTKVTIQPDGQLFFNVPVHIDVSATSEQLDDKVIQVDVYENPEYEKTKNDYHNEALVEHLIEDENSESNRIIGIMKNREYDTLTLQQINQLSFRPFENLKDTHFSSWFLKDKPWDRKHRNIFIDDNHMYPILYFITDSYVDTIQCVDGKLIFLQTLPRYQDKPINITK